MLTRRDVVLGIIAMPGAFNQVSMAAEEKQILGPKVFHWDKMKCVENATGKVASLCKSPTATLDQLEMHVTTLNPGQMPHQPHRHVNEELIIMREGSCETLSNGAGQGRTRFSHLQCVKQPAWAPQYRDHAGDISRDQLEPEQGYARKGIAF